MGTPTPVRSFFMRNMPCVSRTAGSAARTPRSLPKEIFLHNWWLVRAGKHLQVSGLTSRGKQVKEIFHSAPISKRHGTVTVETVDGITISIFGSINRSRTLENGFSNEVCDKFLLGFPYKWEEFASASDVSPSEANPQLRRVAILEKSEDGITMAGAGAKENMNTASEKCLEFSCVDSHASITMADAGERENMNTASGKCIECSCVDSHASETKSKAISDEEGCMGSLLWDFKANTNEITESEGNKKYNSVDYVVPQSCSKRKGNDDKQKVRSRPLKKPKGRNPEIDTSNMRVTRSMKRQNKISLQNTLAAPDGVTAAAESETPKKQSHIINMQRESYPQNTSATADGVSMAVALDTPKERANLQDTSTTDGVTVALETHKKRTSLQDTSTMTGAVTMAVALVTPKEKAFLQDTSRTTDEVTVAVTLGTSKEKTFPHDTSTAGGVTVAVALETSKKETFLRETSATTDGVTATVVLETPKMQSNYLPARCQVPSSSKQSKSQDEAKNIKKSQTMPSLRRSSRLLKESSRNHRTCLH